MEVVRSNTQRDDGSCGRDGHGQQACRLFDDINVWRVLAIGCSCDDFAVVLFSFSIGYFASWHEWGDLVGVLLGKICDAGAELIVHAVTSRFWALSMFLAGRPRHIT